MLEQVRAGKLLTRQSLQATPVLSVVLTCSPAADAVALLETQHSVGGVARNQILLAQTAKLFQAVSGFSLPALGS